jgi:hypothetical protein
MLLAVIYLGILGGGDTKTAALISIIATGVWMALGIVYLIFRNRKEQKEQPVPIRA